MQQPTRAYHRLRLAIPKWIRGRFVSIILVVPIIMSATPSLGQAQDAPLPTIREDVRQGEPSSPPATESPKPRHCDENSRAVECLTDSACRGLAPLTCMIVGAPFVLPHAILGDDFANWGYLRHFPYETTDTAYISAFDVPSITRPWAARFDAEYVATFDHLDEIGGHLLVETSPRFGLDTAFDHLESDRPGGGRDALQIGDCNLVYRFAQGDWGEFRTGLGLNWLNDANDTDLGFNFTYAADIYPRKPWVVSAAIDWGTLGKTSLFRFRATTGIVFHGIETYTGYEYTDIGRTHWNGLIAGLRFWF